jgi:hypothetical protein
MILTYDRGKLIIQLLSCLLAVRVVTYHTKYQSVDCNPPPRCSTKGQLSSLPCIYNKTMQQLSHLPHLGVQLWHEDLDCLIRLVRGQALYLTEKKTLFLYFFLYSFLFMLSAWRQMNPDKISKTICVCRVTDPAQQDTDKIPPVILEKKWWLSATKYLYI